MLLNFLRKKESIYLFIFAGLAVLWLPSIYEFFASLKTLVQIAFLLLPLIVFVQQFGQYSYRYLLLALAFAVFYCFFPFQIVLVFVWWYSIYGLIELLWGKTNKVAFFLPFFYAPVVRYTTSMFGIKLRVWLTNLAGAIIDFLHSDVSINQSEITLHGETFFVDTACIGLKMLNTSFVLLFALISFFERTKKIKFSVFQLLTFMVINFLFLLFSNLVRIVLLIEYQIEPDHAMHDVVGLLAFVFLNLVPVLAIVSKFYGKSVLGDKVEYQFKWIVIVLVVLPLLQFKSGMPQDQLEVSQLNDQYTINSTSPAHGVLVYEPSNTCSVYFKEQSFMRLTNHHPMVCWRFSGYAVTNEQVIDVNDTKMNSAILKKGDEVLYTSWIYVSDDQETISELKWRKEELFQEEDYILINIVSYSKQEMLDFSRQVLLDGVFK